MPNIVIPRGWGGTCHLRVVAPQQIISASWPERTRPGEEVTLTVRTRGFVDGTAVQMAIRPLAGDGQEETKEATITGGAAEASWQNQLDPGSVDPANPPAWEYLFVATVEGRECRSNVLQIRTELHIEVEQVVGEEDPTEAAGLQYVLVLPNGEEELGVLDGTGRGSIDVPPGEVTLRFPQATEVEKLSEEPL